METKRAGIAVPTSDNTRYELKTKISKRRSSYYGKVPILSGGYNNCKYLCISHQST